MHFDAQFIRDILSDVIFFGRFPSDPQFTIDSRTISTQDIFVALNGQRHDGHSFIIDAVKHGAAGLLIAAHKLTECQDMLTANGFKDICIIAVPDPYQALLALASAWRARLSIPVIGITGSVGKTTTKEMVSCMLETADIPYIASYGNQNTQLGAALNLLRMRDFHKVAVFEMGISRRGEMALLAQLIRPTIGVITGVGHSHMEGLGSLADIAAEKRDIFKYFTEHDIGIVNGDQPLLSTVSYRHPVIKFGTKTTNQIQARKVRIADARTTCMLKIYRDKYEISLGKPHISMITNALVTAALSHVLEIAPLLLLQAIQRPIRIPGRFEMRRLRSGKGVIINDCYNANPESMKAALQAFQHIETSADKIAILGDMLELGVNGPFWHRQIGRCFRKAPSLKKVILVGNLVQWIEKTLPIGIKVQRVETWKEAEKLLSEMPKTKEQMILVKGSHAVGLLNLVDQYT